MSAAAIKIAAVILVPVIVAAVAVLTVWLVGKVIDRAMAWEEGE